MPQSPVCTTFQLLSYKGRNSCYVSMVEDHANAWICDPEHGQLLLYHDALPRQCLVGLGSVHLVERSAQPPRKLGSVASRPEVHKEQTRLLSHHVVVNGYHLDAVLA